MQRACSGICSPRSLALHAAACLHPGLDALGCSVLVWSLGNSGAEGRYISHLPHSWNALGSSQCRCESP